MGFFGSLLGSDKKDRKVSELREICRKYTYNQEKLKSLACSLFNKRKITIDTILRIELALSEIKHLPDWCHKDIADSMNRATDFRMAMEWEKHPLRFAELTDNTGRTATIVGAGTATGAAIATLGPTAAMSIATVVGTASTGTAISTLSGVAATNAALAWLGGGTLAAGGAGIYGGSLVLGMFGPVGAAIAGVSAVGGILFSRSKNNDQIAEVQKHIDQIKHDNFNLEPKISHLGELLKRSDKNLNEDLKKSLVWISNEKENDYSKWNDTQKHMLERLVNTVANSVQLINERI